LKNGKEKKINQNFLRVTVTAAVYAAGLVVTLEILNYAAFVLGS
jgi:hypothetical protein